MGVCVCLWLISMKEHSSNGLQRSILDQITGEMCVTAMNGWWRGWGKLPIQTNGAFNIPFHALLIPSSPQNTIPWERKFQIFYFLLLIESQSQIDFSLKLQMNCGRAIQLLIIHFICSLSQVLVCIIVQPVATGNALKVNIILEFTLLII
jgi:hypothetical protein